MNNNIKYIDITKGIGICLVICSHACYPLMSWASLFYIPVFFFISGYCSNHIIRLTDKFWKLILPYVFFTIIALVFSKSMTLKSILGALYARWSLFPTQDSKNIYFLQAGNGPLWFLPSMFTAFCFYKYLQVLVSYKNIKISTNYIIILYIIGSYVLSFLPFLLPWSLDTAPLFALFLYEGTIIRKHSILERLSITHVIILACLYALFRYYTWSVNLSIRYYGRSLFLLFPGASIGCILSLYFAKKIEKTKIALILSKIGRNSLSIFCIHWPFIYISKDVLQIIHLRESTLYYNIIHIILILLITYPISLILNRLVIKPLYNINPFTSNNKRS